jgi:hypothetical protein
MVLPISLRNPFHNLISKSPHSALAMKQTGSKVQSGERPPQARRASVPIALAWHGGFEHRPICRTACNEWLRSPVSIRRTRFWPDPPPRLCVCRCAMQSINNLWLFDLRKTRSMALDCRAIKRSLLVTGSANVYASRFLTSNWACRNAIRPGSPFRAAKFSWTLGGTHFAYPSQSYDCSVGSRRTGFPVTSWFSANSLCRRCALCTVLC